MADVVATTGFTVAPNINTTAVLVGVNVCVGESVRVNDAVVVCVGVNEFVTVVVGVSDT
ncbi:MAG: hypothetical protein ACKPCI_16815 [Dolichospermum sp.]